MESGRQLSIIPDRALIKKELESYSLLTSKLFPYWANTTPQNCILLHSGFLFSEPNFFQGMARIFDLGATFTPFNFSVNTEEADAVALYSDWLAIGSDLHFAIGKFDQ